MNYCPRCGAQLANNGNFCSDCGATLTNTNVEQMDKRLTPEQLRQVQLEAIWTQEKTVPKWMRGTWQAKLSFKQLEKGLTETEKQYLKRKRDTE
jgi:predicted amidophosphoribosyltransferase